MLKIFNEHVSEYNERLKAGDYASAAKIGAIIIKIAKEQSAKTDIRQDVRERYLSCADAVSKFLASFNSGELSSTVTAGNVGGRKKTKWFSDDVPKLSINDIAGLKVVKEEFIINLFAPFDQKGSAIYKKYRGDDIGLQVLLYGPPGTGKTFAVKCLAGQLGCKYAVVQVKDVMSKYVGEGAKVISEVFEEAKELDKCIIFFDELDAIACSRDSDDSSHSREQLIQLLTNMDGFVASTKPGQLRIVIAATNRPWALDSAVLRGGRFETKIYMPLPDTEARKKLISDALGMSEGARHKIPHERALTLDLIARRLEGFSGADIKAVCRQMANMAMKRELLYISNPKNTQPPSDCIRVSDLDAVLRKYIISTTDEDLFRFDAYSIGTSVAEYKQELKKKLKGKSARELELYPAHIRRWYNSDSEGKPSAQGGASDEDILSLCAIFKRLFNK